MSLSFIDTHAHLDGEEFRDDLDAVIKRAHEAGVDAVFVPSINTSSLTTVMEVCHRYAGFCFPMMGLQPEEVGENWRDVLAMMKQSFDENLLLPENSPLRYIAVGECGLDFYWTREFEREQLLAFEEQVKWSVEYQLPLMIHCRKAQNEMLRILKAYEKELPGGVFHCFTGNQKEAEAFLHFDKFCLGIGGVSTFKSSHLREDLPASVPLNRIVLETDSPYMAPVPYRGQRNESAFIGQVLHTLAESYGISDEEMAEVTNENVRRVFPVYAHFKANYKL